jgi:hypothetical protein
VFFSSLIGVKRFVGRILELTIVPLEDELSEGCMYLISALTRITVHNTCQTLQSVRGWLCSGVGRDGGKVGAQEYFARRWEPIR